MSHSYGMHSGETTDHGQWLYKLRSTVAPSNATMSSDEDNSIFITQSSFGESPAAANAVEFFEQFDFDDLLLPEIQNESPYVPVTSDISDISDNELVSTCEKIEQSLQSTTKRHDPPVCDEAVLQQSKKRYIYDDIFLL